MKKLFTLLCLAIIAIAANAQGNTWTIAGVSAIVNGNAWDQTNTANDLTKQEDGTYQLVVTNKTLEKNTDYQYKAVKDHAWDVSIPNGSSNQSLTVAETGIYTITYTISADETTLTASTVKTGDAEVAEHTYSIAGNNADLFGAAWDQTNEATTMTKDEMSGTYTWEKNNVALTAGTIEFKVVQDYSWDVSYPSDNYKLVVTEDNTYNVSVFFNPEDGYVSATITKSSGEEISHIYSIAGSCGELFGGNWDQNNTSTEMTKGEDGIYTWEAKNVELTAQIIEYKVVEDHDWTVNYGNVYNENAILEIAEDGNYDVTITFNPAIQDADKVNATATKVVPSGINNVKNNALNAQRYNAAGQKVGKNYKGLVIANGKKYVVR